MPLVKQAKVQKVLTKDQALSKKDQALFETNTSKGPCASFVRGPDGKFRPAGDECNKVQTEVKEELKSGIEKGEFIGHVYNDGIHHMQYAKADAETTLEGILRLK